MWNEKKLYGSVNYTSKIHSLTSWSNNESQFNQWQGWVLTSVWLLRLVQNPSSTLRDGGAIFLTIAFLQWRFCFEVVLYYLRNQGPLAIILIGPIIAAFKIFSSRSFASSHVSSGNFEGDKVPFLRPLIFPCRTTHTRLFPQKHSFSYSYLLVGIPIGWRGPAGSILSADAQLGNPNERQRQTWFKVEAEDYLQRGSNENSLAGKLREYLKAQGVDADIYPYAYLVTSPRFLDFAFNPASFWYLYDKNKILGAMIVEVNNTFDERRLYFMQRKSLVDSSTESGTTFSHDWRKDFHVSPFNDREGSYSLKAISPFPTPVSLFPRVDNTIVLKSSDGKPKIVTRVFSTEEATEPVALSKLQTMVFLARWWWVGLMTNPRILREARILWVKKLKVIYRPEVTESSIGRKENPDEIELEVYFKMFLQNLAHASGIAVQYVSAAGNSRGLASLINPNQKSIRSGASSIEIRVLTPAFYSEIVQYQSFKEIFSRRCFHAPDGIAMLQISHPSIFEGILDQYSTVTPEKRATAIRWSLLGYLRYPTCTQARSVLIDIFYSQPWLQKSRTQVAELDQFVIDHCHSASVASYQRNATKVLLAARFAFGSPLLLKKYGEFLWILLVCWAGYGFYGILTQTPTLHESDLSLATVGSLGLCLWS